MVEGKGTGEQIRRGRKKSRRCGQWQEKEREERGQLGKEERKEAE
jgi:hypothetical protein